MTKRILIVDDSSIIRSHCRLLLKNAGYEPIEAWDAAQARTALKNFHIAFMICDLNIPGLNGLDLVEAARRVPELAELPVAIMSAECSVDLVKRANRAGVVHWLLKPYTSDELLELVARHAAAA
jgi:two-component system chemotaxis response regulator CheY